MSMHKSLKTNKFKPARNVRKRFERIEKLKRNMKWVESQSVYGLPKEKIVKIKTKIKEKIEKAKDLADFALGISNESDKTKKQSRDAVKIK